MALRKIIPDVVDTLPPDPRDEFTKDLRLARLKALEQVHQWTDMTRPPVWPGLHVIKAPRGVPVMLAAGGMAYTYYMTGRTVISNAELLYGYCPDDSVTDAFAFLAQAPDDSVVLLVEQIGRYTHDDPHAKWSNRAIAQVMDDAAFRGVTILLCPVDAEHMHSAVADSVRWTHWVTQPDVMVETIPQWCQIEVRVYRQSRNPLFEPHNVIIPTLRYDHSMVINIATTQRWDRPETPHDEGLDPHDRLEVGHLSADDAYRQMVERFQARLGFDFTAEDLMLEDWGSLLRKIGKA